jgi:Rieske Fe-S protein
MSNGNNPQSRATKADIRASRKIAATNNVPATMKPAEAPAIIVKAKATKEPKEAKAKIADDPSKITIAALSRELQKDPKTVRARLRRLYDQDTDKVLPQPVEGGQRWTFDVSKKDALLALIANDAE